MRLWKVKAGMRPGRGPELGESLFVRSQAAMGREMNTKSLTGHPMFLKPARPKVGRGEILQTTYFYNLPGSFPSFLLFRWRGPVGLATVGGGGGTCVPREKWMWVQERESPSPALGRGGVCLHQLLRRPSCLVPQREDASCPRANPQINGLTPLSLFRQPPDTPLCS